VDDQSGLADEVGVRRHLGQDIIRKRRSGTPAVALLSGLNLSIRAVARIVLTGPNGSGKTTLLRTMAGALEPLAGRFHLGSSVRLGYMAQEQELLDPGQSALEALRAAAPLGETEARSFLHFSCSRVTIPYDRSAA
jgi:ATP-binding cassette subfamily F protein 3